MVGLGQGRPRISTTQSHGQEPQGLRGGAGPADRVARRPFGRRIYRSLLVDRTPNIGHRSTGIDLVDRGGLVYQTVGGPPLSPRHSKAKCGVGERHRGCGPDCGRSREISGDLGRSREISGGCTWLRASVAKEAAWRAGERKKRRRAEKGQRGSSPRSGRSTAEL